MFVDAVVFITALLGAAMVVSGMGRPRFVPLTAEPDADLAAVGVTVAGLVVYRLRPARAGFLPASIAFVVALVAFLTLRAAHPLPMAAVVVPALLVIGLCLLFQYGFAVPLPAGAWRGGRGRLSRRFPLRLRRPPVFQLLPLLQLHGERSAGSRSALATLRTSRTSFRSPSGSNDAA